MIDLGAIAGVAFDSYANALNDSLEIVGQSDVIVSGGIKQQHAFIYAKGVMYDANSVLLNTVPLPLTNALAVDCQGNVAAVSEQPGSPTHYYLLVRQGAARQCPL
ncbi:MAG TPA: hypothetical protein VGM84_04745 [Steroidobacteraceae bacterium]|jgi:hypothetical protein